MKDERSLVSPLEVPQLFLLELRDHRSKAQICTVRVLISQRDTPRHIGNTKASTATWYSLRVHTKANSRTYTDISIGPMKMVEFSSSTTSTSPPWEPPCTLRCT